MVSTVKLPLSNGKDVTMTGACLDKIRTTLLTYPIQGRVENDMKKAYRRAGGDIKNLQSFQNRSAGKLTSWLG